MADNFDLNLLRVFDAIIRHEHLGKAADELGVTQPSVSYALKQLRELIGDPLFVRAQRGMQPTPRALAIAPVIKSMLEDVREQVLSTPPFDAATSVRTFRLAMPDVSEMAMLPKLLPRLADAAPSVDVCIASMDQRELTVALQRSEVDLAVGYYPDLDGHDVFQQLLFRQTFTCLVRSNHPVLSTGMDREAFQAYPHAVVRIRGNSYEIGRAHV